MAPAPLPAPKLRALALALAPAAAYGAAIGFYGSDAMCNEANMVDEAHVAWGGACWGGSYQYGLGTKWFNGVSNGNTIALSLPYLGNLSVWDSFAITACEPGSVTVGSWAQHPPHPGYCQGAPSQTLTLPLNVCKYDALAGDYKKLLNDACSLPMDSRFFFFDLFYGTSCAPSTLIHSASYWSGSAGQAPDDGSQCQYAEVPSYYGSYQCGTIALLPRLSCRLLIGIPPSPFLLFP